MKEVQNKNHTDEAKRLNEELDQNLKDLQPESKEAFQGFEVKEEKNEKKKKAKKKTGKQHGKTFKAITFQEIKAKPQKNQQ